MRKITQILGLILGLGAIDAVLWLLPFSSPKAFWFVYATGMILSVIIVVFVSGYTYSLKRRLEHSETNAANWKSSGIRRENDLQRALEKHRLFRVMVDSLLKGGAFAYFNNLVGKEVDIYLFKIIDGERQSVLAQTVENEKHCGVNLEPGSYELAVGEESFKFTLMACQAVFFCFCNMPWQVDFVIEVEGDDTVNTDIKDCYFHRFNL